MAAIGVWVGHAKYSYDNAQLSQQTAAMRPLARELMVTDPSKIAVVKLEEYWYDENRWNVYLPPGNYRLCLATKQIAQQGLAPVKTSTLIAPGTHELALEQKQNDDKSSRIIVTRNGDEILRAEEPPAWYPAHGSSGGGEFSSSTQITANEAVVLFRRRFSVQTATGSFSTPPGPCDGLLLWIEPNH